MRIVSIHPARLRVRARRWRVSLCVGLADWEDAAALSTRSIHTEANEGFGFDVRLFSGQNMGRRL